MRWLFRWSAGFFRAVFLFGRLWREYRELCRSQLWGWDQDGNLSLIARIFFLFIFVFLKIQTGEMTSRMRTGLALEPLLPRRSGVLTAGWEVRGDRGAQWTKDEG